MRKNWQKPLLEVLDVKMTMANPTTGRFDGNFTEDNQIPTNENGTPLIGKS
jgi:hypothetical protein